MFLILLRDFLRRNSELIGDGISQIIITLTLADLAVNFAKNVVKHKANEISLIILETLGFIFDNMHLYINYMSDDFEAILNLLNSLQLKSSPEVIARAFKFQKDIYNLFWDQSAVQARFQNHEIIFQKIRMFSENTSKLYYTSENIFFQRLLIRFHPQKLRILDRL